MADFKTMAITATLAGSILLTGATFTGQLDLNNIKSMVSGWADNVTTSVTSTKDMLSKFTAFKSDVQTQLNDKIHHINDLNTKIADLMTKVSSGQGDLASANDEIARLNDELDKANQQVKDLSSQLGLTDQQVKAQMADLKTSSSMDTALTLDTQNADTVTDTTTAPPATPTTPTAPPTLTPEQQQAQTIHDSIVSTYPSLTDLTVTVTASTVTLTSNVLGFKSMGPGNYVTSINNAITPKTATYSSGYTTNTVTYTIQ